MPIQSSNVTHNNNGNFYRIAIDIAKEGTEVWDLTPYFKGRVGDDNFGLQIVWYYQGRLLDVTNMTPYIKGNVGHYSFDEKKNLQMAPDADVVVSHGKPSDCQANGQVTYYFPQQMFPTDGIFKGFIGLEDENQNLTGVDIWFRVLPGVAKMGHACDVYVDVLDKTIADFKEKIRQQSIDFDTALQQELQNEKNLIQQKLDAASGAMDEGTAALGNLAASVGHIQSLINAGDVVPQSEYQKDKEATDTQVGANTRELQSHDAQLKQLTASPSSDGTTEITNARIGTAEQSARTYDTLGEAIRDQAGQITRAVKQSFATSYIAYPFRKEDDIAYVKDVKSTTNSAGSYYFFIKGSALLRIQTTVEPYINFFTFLDANGKVLDYQRSDDKKSTVDFVVAPPSSAATLVLGTEPNSQTAHDSVTVYTNKLEIGKVYQGNISDSSFSLDANMLRASIVIDSDKYENLISVDSVYQVSDDHMDSWDSQVLIPQGSGIKSVMIRKADNSAFSATDAYSHFTLTQIPKVKIHLNSYQNGLTDISDRFRLSYNTINQDSDGHYVTFNSNIKNGKRISSQFVRVDKAESWLIDLDDGYQVSFITAKPDKDGNNLYHDFYDNKHILRTATDWKTGKVYENLYPEGSYAITLGHTGDSLVTINDIWDHVRIYVVDNNVHMPDYYRGYMDTKVRELNDALIDPNNFGFGFITDVHAEYNTKHFPALIDKIRTKTAIDEFMGGGDWATGWTETPDPDTSKSDLFTSFEELRQLFKGVPLLKTIGNHEWAYGANNAYNISTKELYGYYLRDEDKMFRDIHWGADHTYYYWDNQQAKCRYISLNVMDYPDTVKPTGNADNKEWYFKVGDTQIQWLKDTLNSVPDGYVVAIESHLVPLNADQFASFPAAKIGTTISNGEDLQAIASAYAAKTGDFANAKGDLLAWFGGHYHADDITVRNGVTYITTIADCMSVWDIPNVPTKEVGTTSEQAFDIATVDRANRKVNLTRVGAGSDRSFTY